MTVAVRAARLKTMEETFILIVEDCSKFKNLCGSGQALMFEIVWDEEKAPG